jgi:hypothetical protein
MLVLEDDGEGDGTRLEGAGWLVIRESDRDLLTLGKEAGGSDGLSFDADSLVGDETSRLGPGDGKLIRQEPI